jgi:hypothetical protein
MTWIVVVKWPSGKQSNSTEGCAARPPFASQKDAEALAAQLIADFSKMDDAHRPTISVLPLPEKPA